MMQLVKGGELLKNSMRVYVKRGEMGVIQSGKVFSVKEKKQKLSI